MNIASDQKLDLSVAAMLRFSIGLPAMMAFSGGIVLLRHPGHRVSGYTQLKSGNYALRFISGLTQGAIGLDPGSVVQLGLFLLISAPVAILIFYVVRFTRERNLVYVAVSALVLAILVNSFARGGQS